MSVTKMYSTSDEGLTKTLNQTKELFLMAMVTEGIIDQNKANEMNKYCVVAQPRNFFGRIYDKLFGMEENETRYTIVKIIQ